MKNQLYGPDGIRLRGKARMSGQVIKRPSLAETLEITNIWTFEHRRGGQVIDRWQEKNIIVAEGINDILENYFNGSSYTAAHYVGLTDGTPTVADGDTMSSHAGWTEVEAYSETNRQDLIMGTAASKSIDNTSNKAGFSINADATTVGGGFITTDNTKGGTAGTLIAAVAFTAGDKSLDNGDTLNVSCTVSMTSS